MSQLATTTTAQAGDDQNAAAAGARLDSLKPLLLDAVLPMASYYLLSKAFGMSTMAALAWSSVVPAVRTGWGLVRERRVNGLAALILTANVAGLLLSLIAGDPRLMLAKDSGVTGTIGLVVLLSVFAGRPLMSVPLKLWVTKGKADRSRAWDRLVLTSSRFARFERRFSLVWGGVLFGEAVVRVVGAYTLPVDTMVWLSTVLSIAGVLVAIWVSGGSAVDPMEKMVDREIEEREMEERGLAGIR